MHGEKVKVGVGYKLLARQATNTLDHPHREQA
jgi:hypothetical protein